MGALNQYIVMPLGFDPINWMMDPDFMLLLIFDLFGDGPTGNPIFLCGIEAIPRWQLKLLRLRGLDD